METDSRGRPPTPRTRSIAIVPAAGRSRRMGRHKLVMPFGRSTVIHRLLHAWLDSPVDRVVVVVRQEDEELIRICESMNVALVKPERDPPEMKTSIQHALGFAAERFAPAEKDAWLLAPADMPRLAPQLVQRVLDAFHPARGAIVVPTYAGRRGHPVLFPWAVSDQVFTLRADQGVNALLKQNRVEEVECRDPAVLDDLDTPEDYERLAP